MSQGAEWIFGFTCVALLYNMFPIQPKRHEYYYISQTNQPHQLYWLLRFISYLCNICAAGDKKLAIAKRWRSEYINDLHCDQQHAGMAVVWLTNKERAGYCC
jgi:hypothetical protein